MKPIKGLNLDNRPEEQPEGTYPYGKNGIQYDLKGSVTNEKGFQEILKAHIPIGYQHNGTIETDTTKVIIFFTDNTNSCIKLVDVETNQATYSFSDQFLPYKLGFNADNYITGATQRNYIGELVCAFTDKSTFPKFINFDTPITAQLKDWNLFPECDHPTITKTSEAGGYIKVGSYYIASRYYKQDGTRTSFSAVSSGIVITSPDNELIADKLIQITLSNLDQAYNFIELAVICKSQGTTSAVLLRKLPVLPGSITTAYTGNETYEEVSLEEILVPQPVYDVVGSITQLNDALYIAKLEKNNTVLNMQPYANLVKLVWVSELQTPMSAPDEIKDGRKKGFMHGEAYAAYIRYKLTNGNFSTAFHIPGPAPLPADLTISTVATTGGVGNAFVYEVEDAISSYSAPDFTGVCGPYINKTELYPITSDFDSSALGGENLQGTQVRHHKFPSLKWCKENLYPTEVEYGVSKLDLLGVRALNVIIPPEYQNLIVGYEILYAKRTIQNATEYGQGLLIYGAYESYSDGSTADPVSVFSTGHNWNLQQAVNTGFRPLKNRLRFHGFDVLFNKPGIKPSFISAQYNLEGTIDTKYKAFSYPTGSPGDYYGNSAVLVDMTAGEASTSPTNYVNGVESSKYLLNDINSGEYINAYIESALVGKLLGAPLPLSVTSNDPTGDSGSGEFQGDNKVRAHLISLNDLKENIYESFYTQELVSAGDAIALGSSTVFWGGDVFVNPYTFHTYGVADKNWASYYDNGTLLANPEFRGRRIVHRIICETVANLYTRYEIAGNSYSKWFDHNPLPTFGSSVNWDSVYPVPYSGQIDPNQFGYSKGAEGINDFLPDDIFNPYREYQTKFPYRIHRGGKLSRQSTRSWRTFLALDYYECQKNMGFIEHIEGMDDRLIIHHTNSLFLTQDKTKLESGLLSVTLGTGDIFQFEPQEAQSNKLGYAGTQHDLACIRTPLGYIFPDSKQGELYLFKGKLTQLNTGLHRFLREYLKVMGRNSYMGNGITLGWDQKYKRILATVKNVRPLEGTKVTILNSVDDIQDVVSIIGPPNYTDVLDTTQGYVYPGNVVFFMGKFLIYQGLNDLNPTYDCPAISPPCMPVTGLTQQLQEDPIFNHLTWDNMGTGTFYAWSLFKVENGLLVPVATGTTMSTFIDFDDNILDKDELYYFEIKRYCGNDLSTGSVIMFSVAEPPTIVIPGADVSIWVLPINIPLGHPMAIGALYPFGATACLGDNLSNADHFDIEINGSPAGTGTIGSAGGCVLVNGIYSHYPLNSGGGLATAPGPLNACTIKLTFYDSTNNPATFNTGGVGNPVTNPTGGVLFKTDLTPVTPVISGSNNHIFTYTDVHIDPNVPFVDNSYISYLYVSIYT
jgi:hypothetical protein